MPEVSVILPTCDRPDLWPRALASVLAQRETDLEVLLVDSNRQAPSLRSQAPFASLLADARVKLIDGRRFANASQARNAGLRQAAGEWIAFLDDDDEYVSGKISLQLARARQSCVPMVLCGYEVCLGLRRRRIQTAAREFAGDALLLDAIWSTQLLFHRRDPGHFFDETLGAAEDLDYAQRYLAKHGLVRIPNVPEPLVRVHLQPAGRTNTRNEEHWRAARHMLVAHRGRYTRDAARLFLLRALLQRHKGRDGSWLRLLSVGGALLRAGGAGELRRVGNAWLLRTSFFNRWLVS